MLICDRCLQASTVLTNEIRHVAHNPKPEGPCPQPLVVNVDLCLGCTGELDANIRKFLSPLLKAQPAPPDPIKALEIAALQLFPLQTVKELVDNFKKVFR